MKKENKDILLKLLQRHKALGISDQIDFDKFYLYSIIVHSTAIEGSTVTEVEAQLLFDEGITSNKRTMLEQMMNLDLKVAYDYGREWIQRHEPITIDWLILLASKVMTRTGNEYNSMGGSFSAAKGELRKLNVSAGLGGMSYLSYQKVPERLAAFCDELNQRRKTIDPSDVAAVYDLSFWAHYELVTIHPWADGNGRTCRLLMNLLQWEFGVLPTKVLKEDKAEYIQALIDTREHENISIFLDCMIGLHCRHLQTDIDQYVKSTTEKMVDKSVSKQEMVDKWSIKPSLAEKLADILDFVADKEEFTTGVVVQHFGFPTTSAKRYLRQLAEFGYLKAFGGNKNRTYRKRSLDYSLMNKHFNTMKPFNIKTSIFVMCAALLAVFAPQQTSAQELFNGVVTYKMSMNGASATTCTVYYRGRDYLTDMPQNKLRTLYLSEEKKMYSIMSMMGKPIVSSFDYDVETSSLEIFDETTPTEEIAGHHCLRITTDSDNEMMEGKVTIWIDTSYHIASQYGIGLPVRTETRMQMQGRTMETVSELVSVVAGEVDDALFAVPGKEGAVWMTIDADGKPVISGDTTGLYAPIHSKRIEEVDSVGFRKAIAKGKTVCMFTAVWCGPCRLMYPRLENVAKQLGSGYRFIKVDIDSCRTIAQKYDCMTIPVVILFENGKEVRRITSAAYSEEDILKFVEGR